MIKAEILYEHKNKFVAKINGEIAHIEKNEHTVDFVCGGAYLICSNQKTIWVGEKQLIAHSITSKPIKETNDKLKQTSKTHNNKSARERFEEIFPLLQEDIKQNKHSKYYKLALALALQDTSLRQELDKIIKKKTTAGTSEDLKFLIPFEDAKDYKIGLNDRKGELIEIKHIGREFKYKPNPNMVKKTNFKNGQSVCFVYYKKTKPNAEDYLDATFKYYEIIEFITSNGIKPRHKPNEIAEIKLSKSVCDSRNKIEGNSWIAYNDEFMWYVNHKLSPIQMENNIKINNQFAQCWRIPLRQVIQLMEDIMVIDLILFKSSAVPNINKIED